MKPFSTLLAVFLSVVLIACDQAESCAIKTDGTLIQQSRIEVPETAVNRDHRKNIDAEGQVLADNGEASVRDAKEAANDAAQRIFDVTVNAANRISALGRKDTPEDAENDYGDVDSHAEEAAHAGQETISSGN